jgi:hypothetical protein
VDRRAAVPGRLYQLGGMPGVRVLALRQVSDGHIGALPGEGNRDRTSDTGIVASYQARRLVSNSRPT